MCDALVLDAPTRGVQSALRTFPTVTAAARASTTWHLPYQHTPVVALLDAAERLTSISIAHYEPQVVRNEMGQQFA